MISPMTYNGLVYPNAIEHVGWCVFGIAVSLYALHVEMNKKKNPKYVAVCDINDSMSCSRVLTSEYSRGFGVVRYLVGESSMLNMPNCILGIVAYSLQLVLGLLPFAWCTTVLFWMCVLSCLTSLYLASVLFFILKDVCVVCMATYLVNGVLMFLTYQRYARIY